MLWLIVCLILNFHINLSNCDFSSATSSLKELIDNQNVFAHSLDTYLTEETKRLNELKWLREEINQLYQQSSRNADNYLANPVNTFKLVKLSYLNSENVKRLTQIKPLFNHELTMSGLRNESIFELFPDKMDLLESQKALIRLQNMYNLDVNELSKGIVRSASMNLTSRSLYTLTSNDLLEINKLWNIEDYNKEAEELQWCRQAVKVYEEEEVKSVAKKDLLRICARRLPKNVSHISHPRTFDETESDQYKRLCQSEVKIKPSNLKCYFTKGLSEPYFQYNRFKVEELYRNPDVFLIYDVISDREIEELITFSKLYLRRSEVTYSEDTFEDEVSDFRISKINWVNYTYNNLTKRLVRRVEQITGLNTEYSEPIHVQNYGIGGHFKPHYDAFERSSKRSVLYGNRIATWLTYLSDVAAGGNTVFTALDIAVKPRKGNALFWYNLDQSGDLHFLSKHASCPVLLGSKWVFTIWFREWGQEFRKRCGLKHFH